MPAIARLLLIGLLGAFLVAGCGGAKVPLPAVLTAPPATPTERSASTAVPTPPPAIPPIQVPPQNIPFELVSEESLFGYLEALTSIQPYSGWRNAGSRGEAEALDYVAEVLGGFPNLQAAGLELERQSFPVYLATEIWDSRLFFTVDGQEVEVLADGIRGSRFFRPLAGYIDSDGTLNDSDPDPFTAQGNPLIVREAEQLFALTPEEMMGRILILDFDLVDRISNDDYVENSVQVIQVMDQGPAGLVFLTQYSNQDGESRGSFLAEDAIFSLSVPQTRMPILYAHLEDLSPAGIASWDDLSTIESARLLIDTDVFNPGKSGNLIARLPGADPSKAVILGAHIDSPNGPGAFDNGSGSAALLEIARVLDAAKIQPPADLYLCWFGGHEIGTYGSGHFAVTHQDLLDRTLAEIQMDGLGFPMEGRPGDITMLAGSYENYGADLWEMPGFLAAAVASQGIETVQYIDNSPLADNTNFDAFNVPNVYLGYTFYQDWKTKGSSYFHYASHWHDTYETVAVAREMAVEFVAMTRLMLAGALEIGRLQPDFRATPAPNARALFVASHSEPHSMLTSMLRDLGMALSWGGFDVDVIPYGQALTREDLENVGLLVLPPTLDFPGAHNETWSEAEMEVLKGYLDGGGFVVMTNTSCTYALKRCTDDPNEDTKALNAFLEPLGIRFMLGSGAADEIALARAEHPLTEEATYLNFYRYDGVPFRLTGGLELVRASAKPLIALLDYGDQGGQVLVISDLGLLQLDKKGAKNLQFLMNIATYARGR